MTPITPYQLTRTTKRKWLLGQFIYVILVTVLYTVLMLLFTAVLCMKKSYPGNLWSETAAMLGYSELGKNLQVPSTVRVMESISPYGCMLQVFFLLFCYSLTLSFVILVGNLYKGKTKGMIFGLLYSVFGFYWTRKYWLQFYIKKIRNVSGKCINLLDQSSEPGSIRKT